MCKKQLLLLWPLVFSPVYTVYTCYETDVIRHLISKRRENVSEPEQKLTVVSKEAWVKTPIKTLGQGSVFVWLWAQANGTLHRAPPSSTLLGFFSTRFSHVLLGNWPSWQKCVCVLPWFWSVCLCVPESHIWKHQAMFVLLCLFFAMPKPFSSLLFSPALGHLVLVLNKVPAPRPAPPFPNPIVLIMWKKIK